MANTQNIGEEHPTATQVPGRHCPPTKFPPQQLTHCYREQLEQQHTKNGNIQS